MSTPPQDRLPKWLHHFNRRDRAAIEGRHVPSVGDLLAGMHFLRGNLATDAQMWAERPLLRLDKFSVDERVADLKVALKRLTDLTRIEMAALAEAWYGGSLRGLQRLIEGVLAARDAVAGVH